MENKNLIIALVLTLAVWMFFTLFFPPGTETPPSSVPEQQQVLTSEDKIAREKSPRKETIAAPTFVPVDKAENERELIIETDNYRALFTNSGAKLKSLQLKEYKVSSDSGSPLISLIEVESNRYATLRTTGTEGFGISSEALYAVSVAEDVLKLSEGESRQLVFKTVSSEGLVFEKIYTFYGDRYDFDLRVRVTNGGSAPSRGTMIFSLVQPWEESMEGNRFEFVGPATLVGDEVYTEKVGDLEEEPRLYGKDIVWSAFETKYFMGAVVPLRGAAEKTRIEKTGESIENKLETPYCSLQVGESIGFDYLLYFGPRDLDILKQVGHRLEKAVDFGFFTPIAAPLLYVLKFFYSFLGNYGVAIILLTVIIKGLFWPLTQKSYTSMKAMQKLQPEMQKIRERFKNDRERLNREIMELYKKNRVNPLGGCFPMLIQIPVFFALYKVLMDTIELRQAPFALWITDLSVKDPYYVTPLIMGVTMFIQQKLTPTTMDPTQAKIFMVMPVVFTFLFLNFPSGLVIYWLVNNLLTIVQQYYIHRKT
jgi:YidC/Oxa1 family membrane protein insertase